MQNKNKPTKHHAKHDSIMDKIKATVQILFMTQEIGTVELEP
jgi:hypothetical protein